MFVPHAKYIAAAAFAISLLTSCAGGSSTPATTSATALAGNVIHHGPLNACPCVYVAFDYTPAYPQGAVGVYRASARGDVKPLQYIAGSNTELYVPTDVAVDAHGNIYVANFEKHHDSVTVYAAGATGNVAPIATIAGSNTGLNRPWGIALDPLNGDIYVANKEGLNISTNSGTITWYSPGSNGNVAPIGTIAGSNTGLDGPASPVFDASGNLYVPNARGNSITVFAAGSTGNATPMQTITGSHTLLHEPFQLTLDSSLNIYTANYSTPTSLTVYAAGATGSATPIEKIAGKNTKLDGPDGIARDGSGNIYAADYLSKRLLVYPPGAKGNVAPSRQITGANTGIVCPMGMVIF